MFWRYARGELSTNNPGSPFITHHKHTHLFGTELLLFAFCCTQLAASLLKPDLHILQLLLVFGKPVLQGALGLQQLPTKVCIQPLQSVQPLFHVERDR